MNEFIEIQWTSGSIDEARKICRFLVSERLAAKAQITPWVESIYMWNNQLETKQESRVVLHTERSNFERIQEVILKNSSYAIPEIISMPIERINPSYSEWMQTSLKT